MSIEQIRVELPDGSVREVARGTTPFDIATSISPRLAAAVVVARVRPLTGPTRDGGTVTNGAPTDETTETTSEDAMYRASASGEDGTRLVDLAAPLNEDVELWLLKEADEAAL